MRASSTLIAAIKKFEGVRLTAYQDSVGVWTIGYGHTAGVKKGDKITEYQAEQFLREDLKKFEAVADKCKRISTQGKYDAILDFIYNCGPANWNSSTLKKYIEAGKDKQGKGFDPRKLLAPGTAAIKATVKEKMELFGSVGKA